MSYDINLRAPKCPTCGHGNGDEPDCPDPTYNLTPIFDLALSGEGLPSPAVSEAAVVLLGEKTTRPRGLRLLSGRVAKKTMADINGAIDRLADERMASAFVSLEPENKWGTTPDALWVMRRLRELADEYPEHTWEIR